MVVQLFNCIYGRDDKVSNEKHSCESGEVAPELTFEKREQMPPEEELYELSDFFKIFGDSTRIRILFTIDKGPLCVCEICAILGMTKSAISHQLKILRQNNLIISERRGKNVYYSLADSHVRDIIEKALEHIEEKR